jgi:hypothetical protein
MGAQEKAEAKIEKVFGKLKAEEVDALASDGRGEDRAEFKHVAEAVMAWYQLLFASGVIKDRSEKTLETMGSSMLVLATLVKYSYALGVRRGQRTPVQRG